MEREIDLRWGGETLALGHLDKHVNNSTSMDSLLYYTFTDTFLRADLIAVFHSMQGEINLRNWLLVLYGLRQMIDGCITVHFCGVGWNRKSNGGYPWRSSYRTDAGRLALMPMLPVELPGRKVTGEWRQGVVPKILSYSFKLGTGVRYCVAGLVTDILRSWTIPILRRQMEVLRCARASRRWGITEDN